MHAIPKGQVSWVAKGDPVAQRQLIHTIFGIAAYLSSRLARCSRHRSPSLQQNPFGGTEKQDPRVLNKAALHCMHHGLKPVVRAEFLVDAVKVIS